MNHRRQPNLIQSAAQVISSPGWILLLVATAGVAGGGGGGMPWDAPMQAFVNSITGPWAGAIALVAIVVAGATLIFGGELNAFARTMVMIILGVAIIVGAAQFLAALGLAGAVLPIS